MNSQKNIFTRIDGAIFDADGTLLDSMQIWEELGARYLKSLNIQPEKNLSHILYPMSLEQSSSYLREKYKLPLSVNEVQRGFLRIIENFYRNEAKLKSGVKKFLAALDVPKVIATSGNRNLLQAALMRNRIDEYFARIFTCSELMTDKHESKIFMECAKFFELEPDKIAVFEDSLFALKTAKSAGFITVAIEDDSNLSERTEIMNLSDCYVKNFDDEIS